MDNKGVNFRKSCIAVIFFLFILFFLYPTKSVYAGGVEQRIQNIMNQFPSGTYFTANGSVCPSRHSSGSTCNNCKLSNVLSSKGIAFDSNKYLDGWTCYGFASYVYGTIFGHQFTQAKGVVSSGIVNSNEGFYRAFQHAKIGDFVYCMNGDSVNHYAIFISCDSNGVTLYHNNIGGNGTVGKISYGYVSYANLRGSGYGYNRVDIYRANNYEQVDGSGNDPQGAFDVAIGGTGSVYVRGWAFDRDAPTSPILVHIYIGGPAGTAGAEGYVRDANLLRDDVPKVHSGVGNYHGFDTTINTAKTGTQEVYVYAINTGGGTNVLIGQKTVTITKDSIKPLIKDIEIVPDYDGYTVKCKVTDNVEVKQVRFPTWTIYADQDDLQKDWGTSDKALGTTSNGITSFRVNRSDHNHELGTYITDIYAYDKAGNVSSERVTFTFEKNAPTIENVEVLQDDTGYTITCDVSDDTAVSSVRFPTWTASNDQDDIDQKWQGTKEDGSISIGTYDNSTGKATFHVNFSDHNNEKGLYNTDIYAYDPYGNSSHINTGILISEELKLVDTTVFNGHKYELYTVNPMYTRSNASRYCTVKGGHLATITSPEENAILKQLLCDNNLFAAFLGGSDTQKEGDWVWVTGEEWIYDNWVHGNPDNFKDGNGNGQNYVRLLNTGEFDDCWNDPVASEVSCFICEYDSATTYSITYHLDGGKNADSNPGMYTENEIVFLQNPQKEHYTFKGWYLSAEGDDQFQNGTAYDRDLDLYARWEKTQYDITLYANHDIDPNAEPESWSRKVTYDDLFGDLPVPKWDGYSFVGWFTEENGGTQITADSIYTGGNAFYAHWEQNPVHVSYDGNGIFTESLEAYGRDILPGQTYGTLPDISAMGYNFQGWFTDPVEGSEVTGETVVSNTSDHTLYAHWTAKEFTLSFDANMNGLENPASRKVRYKEPLGELPVCSSDDYVFIGWFDAVDGTKKFTSASVYSEAGDLTLVAKWEKKEEPHEHSYNSTVTKEPSCTEPGIRTYTCAECGNSYTEEIPATGHTAAEEKTGIKDASCTEDGYTGDIVCKDCRAVLEKGQSIAATGHKNITTVNAKEATCTEDGYTGDTYCLDCEALVTEGSVIKAAGHQWEAGDITKEVTCTESGEQKYTCSVCKETKVEELPSKGHLGPIVIRLVKGATCTQDGYTGVTVCTKCSEIIKEGEKIPATGHQHIVILNNKEASCAQEGYTGDTYCADCEELVLEGSVIPKTAHAHTEIRDVREATCAQEGYSGDTYCTDCGELITKGTVVPVKEHIWDKGAITKASTATEAGVKTYTCTICGKTKEEEIPVTGKTKPTEEETPKKPTVPEKQQITEKDLYGNILVSEKQMEKNILTQPNDQDPAGSSFSLLQATMKKATKSAITVSWKKVPGATSYTVYGNRCGKGRRYKKLATVSRTKYVYKGLKKGTYYKLLIVANKSGKTQAVSKTLHIATSGGKVGNPTKVKLNKKTVTLKKGKTKKLKATVKNGKLKVKKHRSVKWESSDPTVATVSGSGKVKALKAGKATIYAYAQNGKYAKCTVKVK